MHKGFLRFGLLLLAVSGITYAAAADKAVYIDDAR